MRFELGRALRLLNEPEDARSEFERTLRFFRGRRHRALRVDECEIAIALCSPAGDPLADDAIERARRYLQWPLADPEIRRELVGRMGRDVGRPSLTHGLGG